MLACAQWFHKRHKKAMAEALEKMKAELMLVGFISLLLTVAQDPISKICISVEAGSKMLPCKLPEADYAGNDAKGNRRRLLWLQGEVHRRFLAAPAGEDVCAKQVSEHLASSRAHEHERSTT
jgi:mlo protein